MEPMDISLRQFDYSTHLATLPITLEDEGLEPMNLQGISGHRGLSDYILLEKRGEGAFGEVYKAQKIETGQIIALKVIKVSNQTILRTAMEEIKTLEAISKPCHPFLACYYDHQFDQKNNRLLIEMEYIEGEELQKWITRFTDQNKLNDTLLHLTHDLSRALKYIHSKGVIHRDIKPQNILITKENVPKLIDFGLGCFTSLCNTGLQCCKGRGGTPVFMAPETLTLGQNYAASDIWSFGVTLYVLDVRKYPFVFPNVNDIPSIISTIVQQNPELLLTNNYKLNTIVNGALNKNPLKRINIPQIFMVLSGQ